MMTGDSKKVVVGLSGGVDSASTVLLLQEKGYEVTGLYFDVIGDNDQGRETAEKAAKELGIDFVYRDMSAPFAEIVIENFCKEYSRGRTPNPCIICNPNIKFSVLLEEADRMGAQYIATGHYAKCGYYEDASAYLISMGENKQKDQSYMLYRLTQEVLSRLLLPLGEIANKEDVRQLAEERGLASAQAKDSQEICFIDGNYQDYLDQRGISSAPGNFVDEKGNVLGRHKGITAYTLGQRKGLGVALGKPAFVTKIDPEKNTVTLGDSDSLFTHVVISDGNFFPETGGSLLPHRWEGKDIRAKIRYSVPPMEGIISSQGDMVRVEFAEKQRAATPGQSMVFYSGERVIGGGWIR